MRLRTTVPPTRGVRIVHCVARYGYIFVCLALYSLYQILECYNEALPSTPLRLESIMEQCKA